MVDAEVRANWPKFVLRWMKRIFDPKGVPIVESVPGELRRAIRESPRLTWQSAAQLMDLAELLVTVCGAAGARDFWRKSFLDSISQPMLAPLARGALLIW